MDFMENIRQGVRNLVGWNSLPYRLASATLNNLSILSKEGIGTLLTLNKLKRSPISNPISIEFRSLDHPLLLRPGTSDVSVVINNVIREEYGAFQPRHDPATMIDAGAYIGDTSAYFLSRFPKLECIALEPNPESFELASINLASYKDRARLLPKALSATGETVYFSGKELGARIDNSGKIEVEAITISKLLDFFPEKRVNILKMDIEGAEDEIFKNKPEQWLNKVDNIIIETHGPEITKNVLSTLEENGWSYRQVRGLYFCQPV
ncbi:MAG TPA: FkbM family methyltransferase [Desulfobulbaceae bacterium]|nr:FkbM family methyltransferase [Desulfobulbaceae bacterium]